MNPAVARLADIEPLPRPDLWQETALAVVVLISCVTLLVLWRLHRSPAPSPADGAAGRLASLARRWRDGGVAPRILAYELAALLRYRYRLSALSRHRRPESCPLGDEEWRCLIERLDAIRYARSSAAAPLVEECLRLVERCHVDEVRPHA